MTERTVVKQSKVDDDAISLTSTLSSEYGSDDEFSVDRILADKTEGNKKKYLILWDGYPLEKATWEPHKNINDEILEVWKERKSRESKGLDPPFDVAEFDALLARLAAEKADRHRRRKAKRKRLRLAVSPAPSDADDSDSSVEAIEENEVEDGSRHSRTLSQSSSDTPLSRKRPLQRPSVDRPGSSSSDGPLALKRPKPSAAPPAKSDVWKLTSAKKSTSSTEPTALARGLHSTRGTYTVARGRVATRGGGNVTHKNVFQAREPPKQRGNLLKNARDAAKVPKKFTNMRLHRKAELQARDLAEGAPDISALGGLFDPSRPDSMVPIRPEDLRKASSNMVSLEEPNPLFVNSRENSPVADDPWNTTGSDGTWSNPQTAPIERKFPAGPAQSTCFFWDRKMKDRTEPECTRGDACIYQHRYEEGVPIAPPPPGRNFHAIAPATPKSQTRPSWNLSDPWNSICYFWHTTGKCIKGDNCPYGHNNNPNLALAPSPKEQAMIRTGLRYPDITCPYWTKGYCERGSSCWYRHANVVDERSSENLPSNPNDIQIASRPENNPFEPPPELPNPSSDTTAPAPKAKQKIKMDDYRRKKAFNELGGRAKEVTFGIDETQSLMLDFGDMNQVLELPWGRSFTGVTKVRFDQMCIAQDFQAQQGLLQRLRLWHGNLLPADASDLEALIHKSVGLFSSFPNFLVLAFPAKKDEWKFLESTLDYPQDARARLRYFIFQSDVDIRQSLKMNPTSLAIATPYRDILVDRVHGLDFKKLLPVAKKSRPPNFYLLFPSTASQSAEFIISWLRSSKRTCNKIYSSQSEGSWHYFTHNPEVDNGIVLVHESAAAELHRLPNLYSVVVEKRFTFWFISESNSPYPLFPSVSYGFDDSTMGQLNAIRLFPHGCAFLLTPSFLVAEPHNAYQILNWFILGGGKPKYLSSTPRTWKLVCCYNFADYILELANSKAAEKDAFELKYQNDPAKDAKLYNAGLSFNECNLRYKLHKLLVDFESRRSLESISEFDSDCDESDYPFIHANKHIDPDDEKGLVDWYAAWTMRNLDMYMKFIVVGS
ncbi:hypothetical protein F5882DRAFT_301843, partial [Hyaloscypha sp. PMI_1271]